MQYLPFDWLGRQRTTRQRACPRGYKKEGRAESPALRLSMPAPPSFDLLRTALSLSKGRHAQAPYQFTRTPKRMTRGAMMPLMSLAFVGCDAAPVPAFSVYITR